MTAPEKPDPFEKITDDLNVTRRIAEWAADTTLTLDDRNLWCVFRAIAERLVSIEDRLEAELFERQPGPRLVDDGGSA